LVTASPNDINALKILIADDDEATRILLRAAIKQWGYQIVEASNGEEAWEILQLPDPPRILILDWVMPKLDGVSLCKRIDKELGYHPYIIFLTRMSGTENVIEGLEAGADEFLLKPFDLAELRIRIFAGERIIKYRNQLAEQNSELQSYISKVNELAENEAKELIPFTDLAIILQGIHNALLDVNKKLREDKENNEPAQEKINELQGSLLHIIEMVKGFQSGRKAMVQPELIDMDRMKAFFGDDLAAIQDFMKTFVSLSSEQLKQIDLAIKNQDVKKGKYYFHLLRGASGNSGVMGMYNLCGKGEEKILQSDWVAVNECYLGLVEILSKLLRVAEDGK
jgi:DNA-binding response OmpR family regulator/HPt (histidine-containing phosphotransfer) domain-containing protein